MCKDKSRADVFAFLLGHHGVCERLSVNHVAELLDLRFYKDVAPMFHVRSCAAERRVECHLRDVVVAGNGGNMRLDSHKAYFMGGGAPP